MNALKIRGSKRLWLPTAVALGLAASVAASAAEPPSITLKYEADDLVTTAGAEALYKRIRVAARQVCSPYSGEDLLRWSRWKRCYRQAVGNAVAAVHQPTLTALHAGRFNIEPRG